MVPRIRLTISQDWFRSLRWRNNGRNSVSNHQPHHCLLNRLFRRRSKKTPKLRVTGLCVGDSPGTDEFPAQMASNELATGHCRNQRLLRLVTHECISRPQWVNLLLPKVDTWLRRYLPTLAPVRRQTTSRTNVDWLPIGSLETNCEIWIRWQTFSKMHLKMASAKC